MTIFLQEKENKFVNPKIYAYTFSDYLYIRYDKLYTKWMQIRKLQ